MYRVICALGVALLTVPAYADSLKEQISGAWTLTLGSEQLSDGRKVVPWSAGELFLDPSGHFAFFVFGKDRPKAEGVADPRVPVGPMVAYYGTYDVDEAAKKVTYHVTVASAPAFNGAIRAQTVTMNGDRMVTTGSPVKTPKGEITPINEWKREQ